MQFNTYATSAPGPQQTVDLFAGEWATNLSSVLKVTGTGKPPLVDDPRIHWAVAKLAELGIPVNGKTVLELGPLEGGHTYMLSKMGVDSVIAIEANPNAYLKCLVVKELLSIQGVNFLYGDAIKFLQQISWEYDLGIACGFLYHMVNPVETIELLCKRCRSVFFWTHYWDKDFVAMKGESAGGNGAAIGAEHAGFRHTLHRHDYGDRDSVSAFFGGPSSYAHWMEADEIVAAFRHFGMTRIVVEHERNEAAWGLAMRGVATRV